MTMLFTAAAWNADDWIARLQEAVPGMTITTPDTDFDPAAIRYAAVWHPPHGLLETLPNLEVIFSLGAGVDHILNDPGLPDVPVVRVVNDDLTMRMTGWVALQVLSHHRQQRTFEAFQRQRTWQPLEQPSASSVRVGIMGLGVLGRDAAEKLSMLGFDVAGWSRSQKDIPGLTCFGEDDGLDAFLARTDILVALMPDTPDTRGILNGRLFARLARDSVMPNLLPVLINAGRGALQVEADILAALEDGTLKGASLDVFETEPLPADSPLWDHPLVSVWPHVAADSDPAAIVAGIAGEIARYERGETLRNVVNRAAGY